MTENVKIAIVSGLVSVLVAGLSTIGIVYSKSSELDQATTEATQATDDARDITAQISKPLVPSGAVVPFRLADCPDGWKKYENSSGRVVVGVGPATDTTSMRTLEQKGGQETVALKSPQLPSHSHSYTDRLYNDELRPTDGRHSTEPGDKAGNIERMKATTASVGQGVAHENMPPFVALLYCRKL